MKIPSRGTLKGDMEPMTNSRLNQMTFMTLTLSMRSCTMGSAYRLKEMDNSTKFNKNFPEVKQYAAATKLKTKSSAL